jgi:hypothetical protein
MLRTIGLIILGIFSIGVLSADLEILGLREHPYVARALAAVCVGLVAYTHTWVSMLIALGATTLFLMIRTDVRRRRERKSEGEAQ